MKRRCYLSKSIIPYHLDNIFSAHPCYEIAKDPLPPRNVSKGLVKVFTPDISAKIPTPGSSKDTFTKQRTALHSEAVRDAISSYNDNKVLNTKPTEVNVEDRQLAQLRSGWCRLLNSYMSRLDQDIRETNRR